MCLTFQIKLECSLNKLLLGKEDLENVSGSSQCCTLLFCPVWLRRKLLMLPSNLRSVFLRHLSKLESKFTKNFLENLSNYKWIGDLFVEPTPSCYAEQEKEDYVDLTYYNSLKIKFNSGNPTNFLISLNDECPSLTKKALQIVIPFATSYLCEAIFSAVAFI